jgi:hypothetical protein
VSEPQLSKPQRFAIAADKIGGWDVQRIKKPNGARVVRVSRGPEQFTFRWVPNPGGRGSYKFDKGQHKIEDQSEPYSNLKAALRIMEQPEGKVTIQPPRRRGRPTANGAAPKRLFVERLPFDPDSDTDAKILSACAGRRVTWRTSLNPDELESGVTPRGGIHYKITETSEGKRVLNFVDANYGFRACYVDAIVGVS